MTTHSARSAKTERWLDDLGVTWTFDPDLNLARIDQAASLANQVRHVALDPITVDRYADDMRQGDTFPAIIVDATAVAILGGNHRYAGAIAANRSTHPAYMVTGDSATLLRIAVEDNRNHGKPTTNAERIDHAIALIAAGIDQGEAARITGIAAPKLTTIVGCRDAARRLDGDPASARFAKLSEATRYALSQIDDEAVFQATVDLTLAAALPIDVVRTIVDSTKATEPTEALRLIGQMEEDYADRIKDRAGNLRKASTSARAKLDNALAVIAGLDPKAIDASCPNDDVRAVLAQRIMNAAGVLMPTHELLTGKAKNKVRAA